MVFGMMSASLQLQSHVGKDGTLCVEGLHQLADQDVTIVLSPKPMAASFALEQYAAPVVGSAVADRLRSIIKTCASLPVLDARSSDEILGYNALGLTE